MQTSQLKAIFISVFSNSFVKRGLDLIAFNVDHSPFQLGI
jgi:hypothetical protein